MAVAFKLDWYMIMHSSMFYMSRKSTNRH